MRHHLGAILRQESPPPLWYSNGELSAGEWSQMTVLASSTAKVDGFFRDVSSPVHHVELFPSYSGRLLNWRGFGPSPQIVSQKKGNCPCFVLGLRTPTSLLRFLCAFHRTLDCLRGRPARRIGRNCLVEKYLIRCPVVNKLKSRTEASSAPKFITQLTRPGTLSPASLIKNEVSKFVTLIELNPFSSHREQPMVFCHCGSPGRCVFREW
jgi:hypothetical protein